MRRTLRGEPVLPLGPAEAWALLPTLRGEPVLPLEPAAAWALLPTLRVEPVLRLEPAAAWALLPTLRVEPVLRLEPAAAWALPLTLRVEPALPPSLGEWLARWVWCPRFPAREQEPRCLRQPNWTRQRVGWHSASTRRERCWWSPAGSQPSTSHGEHHSGPSPCAVLNVGCASSCRRRNLRWHLPCDYSSSCPFPPKRTGGGAVFMTAARTKRMPRGQTIVVDGASRRKES